MDKRRRNTLLASAAAVMLLSPLSFAPAQADVLSPILGNYSGHFNNYEDFYSAATGATCGGGACGIVTAGFGSTGQQNFGLDLLGNIVSGGGSYGGPGFGDYLVGVFGGITVGPIYDNTLGTIVPVFAPGTTAFANGGTFHVYEVPAADFGSVGAFNTFMNTSSPSGFTGAGAGACGAQTIAQVAAGTSFCYNGLTTLPGVTDVLDFSLRPSYNTLTLTGGAVIPLAGGPYDLAASFNGSLSGVANTFADVVGGADAGQFASGGQSTPIGTLTDIKLIDDFCQEVTSPVPGTCGSTYLGVVNSNFTVASSDPFSGAAIRVPEPGTLALFGTALIGFGAARRRRKKS